MRCLTPIIAIALVAVLGIAGYNYVQINRMKTELAGIKSKIHSAERPSAESRDLLTALAGVKQHTARAKRFLANGQTNRARLELDRSLQELEDASALSQDIAADAGSGLGATWSTVRREVDNAWKEVSRQMEKGRSGGHGARDSE
jgi:hypothetical protein